MIRVVVNISIVIIIVLIVITILVISVLTGSFLNACPQGRHFGGAVA